MCGAGISGGLCSIIYNTNCMRVEDLDFFKSWFSDYCKSYYSSDAEDQKNIALKEEHTFSVCGNIVEISRRMSLDQNEMLLAETTALFHDIGRFPQFARFKTFRDSISVNHGLLGAETLRDAKVLHSLPPDEQEKIVKAVKFHNAFSVPRNVGRDIAFFIRLVRDADKLDIWRVFLDYYENPAGDKPSAVALGLPEDQGCSAEVISLLYEKKIISLAVVKTLDDFKILQLSWIFDLNFKPSYELLAERQYIGRIIAHLPRTEEIHDVSSLLQQFVKEKLA